MKHVFVICYGRSGSTVLQYLLNSIDGYCIRGETKGVLNSLAQAASRMEAAAQEFARHDKGPTSPFFGMSAVKPASFATRLAEQFRNQVLLPPPGTRVCGSKEICITPKWLDDDEFAELIGFLLTAFDDARIVFNKRAVEEVEKSGWWADLDPKQVRATIAACDRRIDAARERFPDRTIVLDYSEYKSGPAGFRRLLTWLEEPIDEHVIAGIVSHRLTHMKKKPDAGATASAGPRGLLKRVFGKRG